MRFSSFLAKSALCHLLGWGILLQFCAAEEAADVALDAFRKKVVASEDEQSTPPQGGRRISLQLKLLQGFIAKAQYQEARQMLGSLSGYGLPPEIQEEWSQLVARLGTELDRMQAESMEKWRSEVDQLVVDSKEACLQAKSSADLDPLLVRCAALQMRREQQNSVLGERTYRKLSGTAGTLSAWMNYLDFRDAGNVSRANEILRGLRTNDSQFPVLTADEIEARFLTDDAESMSVGMAAVKIFEGVETPEDLPLAMKRLKKFSSNPMNPQLSSLRNEQRHIEAIQLAWEAAKNGDDVKALKLMQNIRSSGGSGDVSSFYEPLKQQIFNRVLEGKMKIWSTLSRNPGEEPNAYLGRILDELQSKGELPAMVEVMQFSFRINLNDLSKAYAAESAAIQQFLTAQRFEDAGDDLAAVTHYRNVLAAAPGKYVPTARAEEALKKLKEKNPDVFENYDNTVMEELRALKHQVQMLLRRSYGGHLPSQYGP